MRERMYPDDFPPYAREAARRFQERYGGAEYSLPYIDLHAKACRLRADAEGAPWHKLAAFTANGTRDNLPNTHPGRLQGAREALCDLVFVLIMEGE